MTTATTTTIDEHIDRIEEALQRYEAWIAPYRDRDWEGTFTHPETGREANWRFDYVDETACAAEIADAAAQLVNAVKGTKYESPCDGIG